MLVRRLLTAFTAGPVVVAALVFGNPAFLLLVAIAAYVAAGECVRLVSHPEGSQAPSLVERSGAVLLVLASAVSAPAMLGAMAFLLALFLALPTARPSLEQSYPHWSDRLAATLYAGVPLSLIVLMRNWAGPAVHLLGSEAPFLTIPRGVAWVGVVISITWMVDSAAFLIGRAIGRRPFSPVISPNKTWEGTTAGVVAGTLVAVCWAPALQWAVASGLALGFLASSSAVLGDLAESALKRRVGVKNAGALLPGHGGILDRIDSLAFSAIVVFLLGTVDESTHWLRLGP